MSDRNTAKKIKSISILSTGSGEVHAEHEGGSSAPLLWWVLTSRNWVQIPIYVFIIEHKDGLILFDTGLDPAVKTNPKYIRSRIGRFLLRRLFRLHISSEDTLTKKLLSLGYSPSDVQKAIISHLHFDHVGGIKDIPQAELLVSEREWKQLSGPSPERDFILREHIEIPNAKWKQIDFVPTADPLLSHFDGVYDVMNDGSMLLLPTPGHTAGSLSLLVREEGQPPLLFTGDLCYKTEYLMKMRFPGTGNYKWLRSSYKKVQKLKADIPDLIILPSHDPQSEKQLKQVSDGLMQVS